jgi:adenylate cyclase
LHGGKVLITWIGEVKKEIVFLGDVLNTTARIAEEYKKAKQDILLSGEIYTHLDEQKQQMCQFYNQLQLRGKEEEIKIYCYSIR